MHKQYDEKEEELLQIDKLLEESIKEIVMQDEITFKEHLKVIKNGIIVCDGDK